MSGGGRASERARPPGAWRPPQARPQQRLRRLWSRGGRCECGGEAADLALCEPANMARRRRRAGRRRGRTRGRRAAGDAAERPRRSARRRAARARLEKEPQVPQALIEMTEKVVLQPHVGSATHATRSAMGLRGLAGSGVLACSRVPGCHARARPLTLAGPLHACAWDRCQRERHALLF